MATRDVGDEPIDHNDISIEECGSDESEGPVSNSLETYANRKKIILATVKDVLKRKGADCTSERLLEQVKNKLPGSVGQMNFVDKRMVEEMIQDELYGPMNDLDEDKPENIPTIQIENFTSIPEHLCKCDLVTLSDPLAALLGVKQMMRHEVLLKVRKYIFDNDLLVRNDERFARSDKKLEPLFGTQKFAVKRMFPFLDNHMQSVYPDGEECDWCKEKNE